MTKSLWPRMTFESDKVIRFVQKNRIERREAQESFQDNTLLRLLENAKMTSRIGTCTNGKMGWVLQEGEPFSLNPLLSLPAEASKNKGNQDVTKLTHVPQRERLVVPLGSNLSKKQTPLPLTASRGFMVRLYRSPRCSHRPG